MLKFSVPTTSKDVVFVDYWLDKIRLEQDIYKEKMKSVEKIRLDKIRLEQDIYKKKKKSMEK